MRLADRPGWNWLQKHGLLISLCAYQVGWRVLNVVDPARGISPRPHAGLPVRVTRDMVDVMADDVVLRKWLSRWATDFRARL